MERQRRLGRIGGMGRQWIATGVLALLLGALTGFLSGCASTNQARNTETSGFLQDYSAFRSGDEGEAQLLYVDPSAGFGRYKQILMDPIVVYANSEDSSLHKVQPDELKGLLDYFDATVREQLQADYTFVSAPGPDTMRLRIALTEARGANVLLSAASSVTPAGMALNGLKKAVTGASTGVGTVGAEMELVDAQSGKRLAAAVDQRVGTKASSFAEWQSAKEAFDFWAQRMKTRLAELRSK